MLAVTQRDSAGIKSAMNDQDGPLFLVVTIKPRLDRLEEAEAQLQSIQH